jgi:poly(3-hydroxybutyrate) depolymerase
MAQLLVASLLAILGQIAAPLMAQESRLAIGASQFIFEPQMGPPARRITVWTYRPKQLAHNAPMLFVMHGVQRNGRHFRDEWQGYAERAQALLLVPEFASGNFPSSAGYSAARPDSGATDEAMVPAVYRMIEEIFDRAKLLTDLSTPDYRLYGHSAGAQFVHRFVMYHPQARLKIAVAANAGWYMMPEFAVQFPYGLSGSGISVTGLKKSFAKDLIVLLGDKDSDPMHPSLNRGARQMRQGPHRFARGQNFFRIAQETAAKLDAPLAWRLSTVPGADHDNAKMAPAAATWLFR